MKHESRYYQIEAKEASQKALKKDINTQMVVAATGTGKTKMGVDIIRPMGKVLWINHNIELITQSAIALLSEELDYSKELLEEEITARGGLMALMKMRSPGPLSKEIKDNIGIIKEGVSVTDKRITIASIQTLWRRLDNLPEDLFDVVVVDECHHSCSVTWTKALQHFKPKLRLGLTATPWRSEDDLSLDDLFEEIVYEYTIQQGIKDGYLSKPKAIKVSTSANLDKVHTQKGDFNQKELSQKVNTPERNYLIANKYLEYAKGRPFIAFCCDVEHTIDLCEALNEKDIKTNYVVGDKKLTPERTKVIDEFKAQNFTEEEAEGLTNCMIATEGFDFANIGCVILACPTKSKTKFWQMLGRGLRKKDDYFVSLFGQNCIILDIVDNTTKHRAITCESEDKLLDLEDKIFISDIDRQKIRDVQEARARTAEIADRDTDELFELFPLPKVPVFRSKRLNQPATPAQLERIRHFGYDVENTHYTMAMIADIFARQPAYKQDIDNLSSAGYDTSRGVTVVEVKLAYAELVKRDNGTFKK